MLNIDRLIKILFTSSMLCFIGFLCQCLGRCSFSPHWVRGCLFAIEYLMLFFFITYLFFLPIYLWISIKSGRKYIRLFIISLLFIIPMILLILGLLIYFKFDKTFKFHFRSNSPLKFSL